MSDPNAVAWAECRMLFGRLGRLSLWVSRAVDGFVWQGDDGESHRIGAATSLLLAKREAEACARAWASVDAYCLPGGKEGRP